MEKLEQIVNGLMGVPNADAGFDRQSIAMDFIDRTTSYLLLKKDELPLEIRKQLEANRLVFQDGIIWHTAQFTSLSGNVNLVEPDHKSGPFWSSLNKGHVESDALYVIDGMAFLISEADVVQNITWAKVNAMIKNAIVEIKVDGEVVLAVNLPNSSYSYFKQGRNVNKTPARSFLYPVIIAPGQSLQITIKLPPDLTINPQVSGNSIFVRTLLYGIKTYKK